MRIREGLSFFVCIVHQTCSGRFCRFYVKPDSPGVPLLQGNWKQSPPALVLNGQNSRMMMDEVPKVSRNLNAFF